MADFISGVIAPFTGIGFLLGCLPLVFGLGIQAIINILKKI